MINCKSPYYLLAGLCFLFVLSACHSGYILSMEDAHLGWDKDSVPINRITKNHPLKQQDSLGLKCIWANNGYKIYSKGKYVKRVARQLLKSSLLLTKEDSFYYKQLKKDLNQIRKIHSNTVLNKVCTNLLILRYKKKGVAVYSEIEGQFVESIDLVHDMSINPLLDCTSDTLIDQITIYHGNHILMVVDYPYIN